jgi:hypothetical protein
MHRTAILLHLLVVLVSPAAWGNEAAMRVELTEPEVFGTDTPLGRLSYEAGHGLRVGRTGLVIGGFATAEAEHLENGESRGGLDELSFLVSFKPVPFVHLRSSEWGRWRSWSVAGRECARIPSWMLTGCIWTSERATR